MRRLAIALVCLGFLSLMVHGEAFIVKDGKLEAEIVVAKKPARMTKLAAKDLRAFLKKITGAELAVVDEPTGKVPVKIYVGKSAYTEKLGMKVDDLEHGAYKMVSGSDWLALLGNDKDFVPQEPYPHDRRDRKRAAKDWEAAHPGEHYAFPYSQMYRAYHDEFGVWSYDDRGTMNAVCAFLRNLGVRWYFPGEIGEVVPKMKSVPLPKIDETVKPDFPMRRFSFWYMDQNPDVYLWNLRLGVNPGREMMGLTQNCHGSKFLYMEKEIKESHPEWYSLRAGKRATDHSYSGAPCLSNPELFDRQLRFARMMFDERDEPMLSVDMCDGYGCCMCQCPMCVDKVAPERGWSGNMSDYVCDYVERVAKEMNKTHPDRKLGALSYSSYLLPPEKIDAFSPNVALVACQTRSGFVDPEVREKCLKTRHDWWDKLPSKELYIYDYYLHSRPKSLAGIPVVFPHLIAEDLRSLKGIAKGEMTEVYLHPPNKTFDWHSLATMHLNIYVTTRLWWDADLDMDQLLDEYCEKFYGPAAKEMRAFFDYSEKNWPSMSSKVETIDKVMELLAAAQKAAGDGVYGQRVKLVADSLKSMKARKEKLLVRRENAPKLKTVEREKGDLKLDGKMDESFWKDVPVFEFRELESGDAPKVKSTFKVAWSERKVIFGVRCEEPDMKGLNATTVKNDDQSVFNDDHIEFFIETPTHIYYQIALNPNGAMLDMDCKSGRNTLWSSEAEVAVDKGPDAWTAEIAFPTADLIEGGVDANKRIEGAKPTQAAPWYFNVCRQRTRDGQTELTGFAPTGKRRFKAPDKYGELTVE